MQINQATPADLPRPRTEVSAMERSPKRAYPVERRWSVKDIFPGDRFDAWCEIVAKTHLAFAVDRSGRSSDPFLAEVREQCERVLLREAVGVGREVDPRGTDEAEALPALAPLVVRIRGEQAPEVAPVGGAPAGRAMRGCELLGQPCSPAGIDQRHARTIAMTTRRD